MSNQTPLSLSQRVPIVDADGTISKSWWRPIAALLALASQLTATRQSAPIAGVFIGSSPYIYQAPYNGVAIITAGAITTVSLSRDGTTFFPTGTTFGCYPMSQNDTLSIGCSSGIPTLTFIPT